MLDTISQPRANRHSQAIVNNPHDREGYRAFATRSSSWRFFGRREETTVSQRCLALHLHFASPRSALD